MRWLALFLALLIASTASANTLIVRCNQFASDNAKVSLAHLQSVKRVLDRRGATYKVTHISNVKTEWMRTGLMVWSGWNTPNPVTEQFDAILIFGFDRNGSQPTGSSIDSLTLGVKWPQVPVVIYGAANTNPGKWTAAATCSTGVSTPAAAYSTVYRSYVYYQIGTNAPWRNMSANMNPSIANGAVVAGTTFRPHVALNYSATVPGGAPTANSLLRAFADSTGYTSAGRDTLAMWERMNTATNVPLIFVEGNAQQLDPALFAMAMQRADSASGGNVWDGPRAKPIQAGLAITGVASRGHYARALDTQPSSNRITSLQGSTFCYADSCDSTNVLAGLDSLGTLAGLKTTFYADPCSLATYPSVKNWLYRAGQYRVGIQGVAGFGTGTTQIMGNASATYPIDPLGATRTRYAAQSSASCGNASDTALVICGLLRGRSIIREYFNELFDPSIHPAGGDWSPVAFTRAGGGPGVDSMAYALHKGGVRAVVIRPEWLNSAPGVSSTFSAGVTQKSGATSPASNPLGYGPDARRLPVYSDPANPGTQIGSVHIVAERGEHGMANVAPGGFASHDTRMEWMMGLVDDVWFVAPIIGHTHLFMTRTQVLRVSIGRLGGHGGDTSGRVGWYDIKHTHNQFEAANRCGWVDPVSGIQRKMFEWRYVSDLEFQP